MGAYEDICHRIADDLVGPAYGRPLVFMCRRHSRVTNNNRIAVRGGHHCAQLILCRFGLESTPRATLALYNTCEEIDALVSALWDLQYYPMDEVR